MTVLVTGASSGIGRSLALLFARDGHDLVLVARREDALAELAREVEGRGRSARVYAADLAAVGAAAELHQRIVSGGLSVDVLVNNAGVGMQGRFDALPLDRQIAMIHLNVTTLTALTRLLLPAMLQRNSGGVLNVASTAAFQPGPLMAVYYATKAYVLSFTEALAEEVSGSRLRISCLCPGPTLTGFAEAADMTGSRLFKAGAMSADEVARIGVDGWSAGKRVIVPGFANRVGAIAPRFSPRGVVTKLVKRLNVVE
jgi:short-subunit dehydrogenase